MDKAESHRRPPLPAPLPGHLSQTPTSGGEALEGPRPRALPPPEPGRRADTTVPSNTSPPGSRRYLGWGAAGRCPPAETPTGPARKRLPAGWRRVRGWAAAAQRRRGRERQGVARLAGSGGRGRDGAEGRGCPVAVAAARAPEVTGEGDGGRGATWALARPRAAPPYLPPLWRCHCSALHPAARAHSHTHPPPPPPHSAPPPAAVVPP